jgi:PAS domain S-box-containing protein
MKDRRKKDYRGLLTNSEARYRALLENFPSGSVTLFDRDLRILFVGGEDTKRYGSPEAVLGKLLSEVAPAETWAIVAPNLRLAFEGKKVTYRATATPLVSMDGSIAEVLVVAANITEQERAREALQESEQRFRLLAEVTNDAIWDWDLVTDELWWNEGFETLFGYRRAEIEKTIDSWYNRVHPAERARVISGIHRLIDDGGTTWSDEYRFLCKNGNYAYVQDRGRVIRNTAGKPVRMVGGMRDLTERNQAEEAAHALPAELLKAQDEERRRIARELHDSTAQELAVVSMNLGRLEEWIEGRDAWAENLLADSLAVLAQGNRDLRTLAHLLHPPMLEELGLIGALRDYVGGFSARSEIEVALEFTEDFERCSEEIETALFRVVQESLANVHRHSGSKAALVKLVRAGNLIELTIADGGKGLPTGLMTGTADRVRVGVGISGMRQRILQLQGRLEITSDETGTTVFAVLPFRPERIAAEVSPAQ